MVFRHARFLSEPGYYERRYHSSAFEEASVFDPSSSIFPLPVPSLLDPTPPVPTFCPNLEIVFVTCGEKVDRRVWEVPEGAKGRQGSLTWKRPCTGAICSLKFGSKVIGLGSQPSATHEDFNKRFSLEQGGRSYTCSAGTAEPSPPAAVSTSRMRVCKARQPACRLIGT